MYRQDSQIKPLVWRRLSNEGGTGYVFDPLYAFVEDQERKPRTHFITEEKILATF
jgi:hypothetical protein